MFGFSQVEHAEVRNRSTKMEVQKPKYRSEKNSLYQCLVHYWLANVCVEALYRVANVKNQPPNSNHAHEELTDA